MDKRGKQASRKRKSQMLEEDDKQNESILEEVLSISGKNVETSVQKDESPPVQLKKSADKKGKAVIQPKKVHVKKLPVSPPSPPPKRKKSTDDKKGNTVNEDKKCNLKKGQPVPNLPDGWRRESVVRRSGKTAGQMDIYFYSPDGRKLRSRPDVASYLFTHNMNLKLEEFDFSKKKSKAAVKKKALGNSATSIKKGKVHDIKVNEVESKNSSKAMSAKKSKTSGKSSVKVPLADAEDKKDPEVNEVECKNSKGMSAKRSKLSEKSSKVPLDDTEGKKNPEVNKVESKNSKSLPAKRSKPEKSSTKVSLADAEDKKDPEANEVDSKNSKCMPAKRSKPTEKSCKVSANAEDEKDPERKSNTILIKILESKPKKSRK